MRHTRETTGIMVGSQTWPLLPHQRPFGGCAAGRSEGMLCPGRLKLPGWAAQPAQERPQRAQPLLRSALWAF